VISKGKSEDPSQDILKSPPLANSLMNMIKLFIKIDSQGNTKVMAELLTDLIRVVGLLGRATFNKSLGIDINFVGSFLPLISKLLYYPNGPANYTPTTDTALSLLQINTVKSTGIFLNQSGLIPLRSLQVYEKVLDLNVL
jgi:hypothetical protein